MRINKKYKRYKKATDNDLLVEGDSKKSMRDLITIGETA